MARRSAPAAATSATPSAKPRSWAWLQGAGGGALICLATPTALLLFCLTLPVIAGAWFEADPRRPRTRCAALFVAAVACLPLRTLWTDGNTLAVATHLLRSFRLPLEAWAAAIGGWLLAECAMLIGVAACETRLARDTASLSQAAADICRDWPELA